MKHLEEDVTINCWSETSDKWLVMMHHYWVTSACDVRCLKPILTPSDATLGPHWVTQCTCIIHSVPSHTVQNFVGYRFSKEKYINLLWQPYFCSNISYSKDYSTLVDELVEKYQYLKDLTYTGTVLLRCIIISARLLVLLALCAHDTGIASSLYHLVPDSWFLTSVLFPFRTKTVL